jgi:hypothetical protein
MTHLFTSDTDGALYDTRQANWSSLPPLRKTFRRTFRNINTLAELKATMRNGSHTDLGGYPLVLYMGRDWLPVSFDGVKANWHQVVRGMLDGDHDWIVVGCDIYWEGSPLVCELTGQLIESAYGDPEADAA